jgi:UDP-N-acetylmuramyl pentapeptide synthase
MGFMYSLGEETFQQHEHIFRLLESNFHIKAIFLGDDKLYTLPFINKYKNIISRETHFLSCLELVKTQSIKNIFIKGSRGSALEKFIKEILNNI